MVSYFRGDTGIFVVFINDRPQYFLMETDNLVDDGKCLPGSNLE